MFYKSLKCYIKLTRVAAQCVLQSLTATFILRGGYLNSYVWYVLRSEYSLNG